MKKILVKLLKLILGIWLLLFLLFVVCKIPYQPMVIHSEGFMNVISLAGGFEKDVAKAAAPFPFVILRYEDHEMNDTWVRHETIHHLQYIETLGFIRIYSKFEYLYARIILDYDHMNAYLYQTTEQEAYLHQEEDRYLKDRNRFGFGTNIVNKEEFELVNFHVELKK